ncbi:MAG: hypothetical protein ACJAT2_002921 [Bacteriovoracaceae bacterium]|jgi:hypothetical protein
MKKLTILLILLLPLSAFARKPAVEPVTGISIDEYKEVPPSQAKGYNWNEGESKVTTEAVAPKGDPSKLPSRTISEATEPNLKPAFILVLLLVLPFGIWFFMNGKLDDPETEIGFQDEEIEDNTLAFPKSKKNDDDNDDDDFNIPKAS